MENKKKIAQAEDYFSNREKQKQKQAEKEQQKKSETKTETWSGTVEGEGTSKKTNTSKKKAKSYDEPIDDEWREVNSETINSGRSYINPLLLEDKNK